MTSFRKFFFYCAAICFRRSFMCFNNSFYCAAIGFRKSFAMKFTVSSCANSLQTRTQCQRWFIIYHLSFITYHLSFILYNLPLIIYHLSCGNCKWKQIPNVRGDLSVDIESQFEPNFLFYPVDDWWSTKGWDELEKLKKLTIFAAHYQQQARKPWTYTSRNSADPVRVVCWSTCIAEKV